MRQPRCDETPNPTPNDLQKQHAPLAESARSPQHRLGVAATARFRALTAVAAVLLAATACDETTTSASVTGVSATAEISDTCPDGLRQIESPEETRDLRCADLNGARLTGAFLNNADLTGADLSGARLTGAFLNNADLVGADLSSASLAGADLNGADLAGADLSDANLTGAFLAEASLAGTIWADTTCPSGSNSDKNGRNSCP